MASESGGRWNDVGLLILRLGIGAVFVGHGVPKLLGGPSLWEKLGMALGVFGISFAPAFWGFMAGFSEAFGGLAVALGFLLRPFCALLTTTMIVAASMHLSRGDGFTVASHAMSMAIVFLSLILIGPGRYRAGALVASRRQKSDKSA